VNNNGSYRLGNGKQAHEDSTEPRTREPFYCLMNIRVTSLKQRHLGDLVVASVNKGSVVVRYSMRANHRVKVEVVEREGAGARFSVRPCGTLQAYFAALTAVKIIFAAAMEGKKR
jgi:hypothetical protein